MCKLSSLIFGHKGWKDGRGRDMVAASDSKMGFLSCGIRFSFRWVARQSGEKSCFSEGFWPVGFGI